MNVGSSYCNWAIESKKGLTYTEKQMIFSYFIFATNSLSQKMWISPFLLSMPQLLLQ